ncbi:protein-glutamate methylesterase/protein-glutamine glutaminase [Oceanobacillus sp. CAU 1775]
MKTTRVLIVDDSAFMRKMITSILESDSRIKVIGTARNGADGIKKIKSLKPDVVTMDVNMPVLDGISALQIIMKEMPLPVIMLSSQTARGTDNTIAAIEEGAVDFIMKPSGEISLNIEMIKNEIVSKVIAASSATIGIEPKEIIQLPPKEEVKKKVEKQRVISEKKRTIIVLGTSTGGPRALQKVITSLPKDFRTPILIVQHMPKGFTKSLADRLNGMTHLHVKEAEHGEVIQAKSVYIAPGGFHMRVEKVGSNFVIHTSQDAPINNHRPSVDALFFSASKLYNINKIAVVLTGMGNDGSAGIINMKEEDQDTIILSESEKTATIYGMPRAAYETNVVDQVLPIDQVGKFLGEITRNFKS